MGIVASHPHTRKTIPGLYKSTSGYYFQSMEELTLTVTAREADLLRKLLVALRSVVRVAGS
jgi:hypothetical protein